MKCLVTGGLGFIGSHVVDRLIENNFDVIVLDNEYTGSKKNLNKHVKYICADIRNFNKIKNIFLNVDYVFHLAAFSRIIPSIKNPVKSCEINVKGTINCLLAAKRANVKKFIFSSSSSVYGNPVNLPITEEHPVNPLTPYAIQKYEGELYCKFFSEYYGMETVVLRYFNVYGPRSFNPEDKFVEYSSPVGIFINQKKQGKPLTITGNGEQKRDYVHVYDVARANISAMSASNLKKYEVFNIGSGTNHTVNEIADIIGGERIYIQKRQGEPEVTLADISKAKKLLNWKPEIDFKKGIIDYMKLEGLK